MSIEFHRHCQATVLSANGTRNQNGETWDEISSLKDTLTNLPTNWIDEFKVNKNNITQDLASILRLINGIAGDIGIKQIILNGATKNPINRVVDLGSVVTSIKLNGQTNTPDEGLVDLGDILTTSSAGDFVHISGIETITGSKTFTQAISLKTGQNPPKITTDSSYAALDKMPPETDSSNKIATTEWVRKVIQVDDSNPEVVHVYVDRNGNDESDGTTKSRAKKNNTVCHASIEFIQTIVGKWS